MLPGGSQAAGWASGRAGIPARASLWGQVRPLQGPWGWNWDNAVANPPIVQHQGSPSHPFSPVPVLISLSGALQCSGGQVPIPGSAIWVQLCPKGKGVSVSGEP